MQALMGQAAEDGVTVLFSSHRLQEMEQIADYLCMIHRGRALMSGPLDDLKAECRRVVAVFPEDALRFAPAFSSASRVRSDGRTLTVLARGLETEIVGRAEGLGARSVEVESLSLREMFLELVKGENR